MADQDSTRLIMVRQRFRHMGQHSGYDQLCSNLEQRRNQTQSIWLPDSHRNRLLDSTAGIFRRAGVLRSPWYGGANLRAEAGAILGSLFGKSIIHVFYGENNLGLLLYSSAKTSNRLVVTAHQPLSWWQRNRINLTRMSASVDLLVVLSNGAKHEFESRVSCPVRFVPHGVDTGYFSPPGAEHQHRKMQRRTKRCLFVGQWLRDFTTLNEVLSRLETHAEEIRFDLVIPALPAAMKHAQPEAEKLRNHPLVSIRSEVSDAQLLALYRDSNVLVLPMLESTANNAILEAIACGLPIVTTATSGMTDYVDPAFARVCEPGNAEQMARATLDICRDAGIQDRMSRRARSYAVERLDWKHIAQAMNDLYAAMIAGTL